LDNRDRVLRFTERTIPGALGRERRVKTCLYTMPPDREFIVDRVPGQDRVHVCVGAGHAFKFATQLGRVLAELALEGETAHDLSLFRADRGILTEPDAPRTWMV
jgi:sarcosine oxidase